MKYLLVAIIGFVGSTFIANGILPALGIYFLVDIGPAFTVVWMSLLFFAVTKQRLFGLKPLMGKTIHYLLKSLIYFVSFYFIYYIQNIFWGGIFHVEAIASGLLIAILFTILFESVDKILTDLLKRNFIHTKYNPHESLSKILKSTSTELNIDIVIANILSLTKKALGCSKIGVIVFEKATKKTLYQKFIGFDKYPTQNVSELMEVIDLWEFQEVLQKRKSEILVQEEVVLDIDRRPPEEVCRLEKILAFMQKEAIAVVLPLNRKVQLNGLIIIGHKPQQEAYTIEDINFLENVVANASVAIGRSLLHKQVEQLSQHLQCRVDEQTKLLRNKVARLKEARCRERDMVDIMGHELRTPASVVNMYFEQLMTQVEILSKASRNKKVTTAVEKYAGTIRNNIAREISLINSLLNAAKIDNHKLILARESVSAIEIVENSIEAHKATAEKKDLHLNFEKPKKLSTFPLIYADKTRFQEVMDNLTSNAIKYTTKGEILIKLSHDDEFVTFTVFDTGKGISKGNIKLLGQKFYRVEQYTEGSKDDKAHIVRPGGTGLGLYVAKGLIKSHGGTLSVESKVNEGSTFSFTVPIFKPNKDTLKTQKKEAL